MKIFNKIHSKFVKLTYVRIIAMGYLMVILAGTLLLLLPMSTSAGKKTGVLTALFTAASATCVTGLVVVDTGTHWTAVGHLVIITMIQIGGLGFMTMGILLAVALKKRISLRARGLLQESMNYMQMGGIIRLVKTAFLGTLLFEGAGAVSFRYSALDGGYFTGFFTLYPLSATRALT